MLKFIFSLVVSGVLLTAILFGLLVSDQPTVTTSGALSHQHVMQTRQLIKNHLARPNQDQTLAHIRFSPQDLNVAVNYLLHRSTPGAAQISIAHQTLMINASLPVTGLGRYFNLALRLTSPGGQLEVNQFSIGQLTMPALAGRWLIFWRMQALLDTDIEQLIESVDIQPDGVNLAYRYEPALLERVQTRLFNAAEPATLRAYANQLVAMQQQPVGQQRQLSPLLQALFGYALERSATHNPAHENQALLTVLGLWAGMQKLTDYVADLEQEPKPFNLKLGRRIDSARHFLLSAALAVRGDQRLAESLGLTKELADAETRSGFSFADMAANQAGIAFGLLATGSVQQANYVQQFMSQGFVDSDIMPPVDGLAEQMDHATLRDRFGGVGEPAYEAMMTQIKQRVANCRISLSRP